MRTLGRSSLDNATESPQFGDTNDAGTPECAYGHIKAHAIHELPLALRPWIDHDDELIKCSLEQQMSVAR